MTVCKFWAQDSCRYGNNCRFEHPPKGPQQSGNRFGVLGNTSNQAMGNRQGEMPYGLNAETIQRDLIAECPPWILSCYGPGKEAPEQLFGGYPREQSFEEIRLHYMQGVLSGNPQGAIAEIEGIYNNARQQIQHTVSNLNAAMQFIVDAGNKHPNRVDICRQAEGGAPGVFANDKPAFGSAPTNSPFGAPPSTFGQPAALGQKSNPFGTPAFRQPPAPAFGQPAALGGTSAFGQPAQPTGFGQTPKPTPYGAPAFGQPAQLGASPFGQPTTTVPFGHVPQPTSGPAFGQPSFPASGSVFGQPAPSTSAFGQPATLGQKPSPFGNPAGQRPFGAGTFGQPAQTVPTPSPFGQPPTSTPPANNPFGQPASTSPFGQAVPAPSNPFGQPPPQPPPQPATQPVSNPFGAPSTTTAPPNPFGQPVTASPFGQLPASQPAKPAVNPFGQPAPALPFGSAGGGATNTPAVLTQASWAQGHDPIRPHPDISTYSTKWPDGRLRTFKGKTVTYQVIGTKSDKEVPVIQNFDGSPQKIWFPNGPPNYTDETEAADPKVYEDPKVLEQWKPFFQTGTFTDGLLPEVPPKREFCTFSF